MLSIIILILAIFFSCGGPKNEALNYGLKQKINGVSFVSPPRKFDSTWLQFPKQKVNANWLCLMPFAFVRSEETEVYYNSPNQWWGEREEGIKFMHKEAAKLDYQILLKPQIWKSHGEFTGHHQYSNSEDWEAFENNYRKFILEYAQLAEELNVSLFCIGTEWDYFVQERSEFWMKLIRDIRKVYNGPLTYAANWDEYKRVPFWKALDFIGVDAYFPLGKKVNPSNEELQAAWHPIKKKLKHLCDSIEKPLLFTEFGFRSKKGTHIEPWQAGRAGEIDLYAQSQAYEVLFENFWKEDFFAGGFLWKWFPNYEQSGGVNNNDFTPQRKPVESIIRKYYSLDSAD